MSHAFFGDAGRVVAALRALDGGAGWAQGRVSVGGFLREVGTGCVCGLVAPPEEGAAV